MVSQDGTVVFIYCTYGGTDITVAESWMVAATVYCTPSLNLLAFLAARNAVYHVPLAPHLDIGVEDSFVSAGATSLVLVQCFQDPAIQVLASIVL